MDRNTMVTITLAVLIVLSLVQAIQISSIATPTAAVSVKTQHTPTQQAPVEHPLVQNTAMLLDCGI